MTILSNQIPRLENSRLDFKLKDIIEINKWYRPIWDLTYRIVSGEDKERVRVVNKDPDNLLVMH
jgi:hypothetical protein